MNPFSRAAVHPHPIFIVESLQKLVYLLLLPLARGAITSLRGGMGAWLKGAWFDLLILLIVVAMGTLRWWFTVYHCDKKGLWVRTGLFNRRESVIPAARIATLSVIRSFYLKPFGAVRLRADTPAGSRKEVDFSLTVGREEADWIMGLREEINRPEHLSRTYHPKGIYIITLSMITSNSFAGLLLTSTFISHLGQVLGEELSNRLMGTFHSLSRKLAFGIPPAAAAVAYLLLFGWLLAFLINLIRHKNFFVRRNSNTISIKGGIFTNREYSVQVDAINYVDIQQTVFTKLLGLQSVFVHAVGYGKDKNDIISLIPAATKRDLALNIGILLPEFPPTQRLLKPNLGALFKFIGDPFWLCLLIPLASWGLAQLFWAWRSLIFFFGLMLSIPAYWFLVVRLLDFLSSGVSKTGDIYTLRYSNGFYLHTVIIPKSKIVTVGLRQSILQMGDGKCDLQLYSYTEGRKKHHCKNLGRQELMELFEMQEPKK